MRVDSKSGFFTLIGLLLALLILSVLYFTVFKTYFGPPQVDEEIKEEFRKQGINIDTSNYRSTLNAAKKSIQKYNKDVLKREQEMKEVYK